MLKKIIVATALMALAGPVLADETPLLDRRQDHQQDRIRQGVESGQLTRQETRQLVQGQHRLRSMEQRVKSDGQVTAQERSRLQHQADVQSRHIYRQKHDNQVRRGGR